MIETVFKRVIGSSISLWWDFYLGRIDFQLNGHAISPGTAPMPMCSPSTPCGRMRHICRLGLLSEVCVCASRTAVSQLTGRKKKVSVHSAPIAARWTDWWVSTGHCSVPDTPCRGSSSSASAFASFHQCFRLLHPRGYAGSVVK